MLGVWRMLILVGLTVAASQLLLMGLRRGQGASCRCHIIPISLRKFFGAKHVKFGGRCGIHDTVIYMNMIIGGFWIGNRIYWTILYNTWLPFTEHGHTHNSVLSHALHQVSCSGFQRRTVPFLWIPELSPCLSHNNSRLTDWLVLYTHWLCPLAHPACNISARTTQTTPFLIVLFIVGCRIFLCFAVVA
jgi:hypothetical protein